jgi:hypothetical protein
MPTANHLLDGLVRNLVGREELCNGGGLGGLLAMHAETAAGAAPHQF